jgi:nucleotide sugar dehydrogenase
VDLGPLEAAIRTLGARMREDALVLVESTVPPGTCASLVVPRLREAFARRGLRGEPLVAHSYERVMPGPEYLHSITRMWRAYAGNCEAAAERAGAFLAEVIDTARYPATRLADTTTCELAKVLENSYRATNIALVQEWGRLAERAGVDLYAAIEAIRVRKGTHDNLRYPGFGVGGYCLTKDALLADWAARHDFGICEGLPFATEALRINEGMPRHVFRHLEALAGDLRGKRVALLGVSYLPGVADTRFTPAQPFCDLVEAAGGEVIACDPMLRRWDARTVFASPLEAPAPLDAVVFAVPHPEFRALDPEALVRHAGRPPAVVDGHRVLEDAALLRFRNLGCRVSAVGRGHLR